MTRRFIYDYAPDIPKVYQHQTVLGAGGGGGGGGSVDGDHSAPQPSQQQEQEVNMDIWDTAGHFQSQVELRHLEVYVRWADVILLVYSITDKASFHLVGQLLEQVSIKRWS